MKYLIILTLITTNLLGQVAPGVPETIFEMQEFTSPVSNFSVTIPTWATSVTVYVVGAGGGGGSGRRGPSGAIRCGGGGGAGGNISFGTYTLAS